MLASYPTPLGTLVLRTSFGTCGPSMVWKQGISAPPLSNTSGSATDIFGRSDQKAEGFQEEHIGQAIMQEFTN